MTGRSHPAHNAMRAALCGAIGLGCGCQAHRRDYASMTAQERTVQLEASIEVERPVEVVAEFLADPCKEFLWQPWLRSALMTPPDDGVGTVRRYVNRFAGKEIVNEYRTQSFERGRSLTYHTTDAANVPATGGTHVDPLGPSKTRVTLVFEPQALGFYWYMSDRRTTRVYQKNLQERLEDLRQAIEAGRYEQQLRDAGVKRRETEASVLCWIGRVPTGMSSAPKQHHLPRAKDGTETAAVFATPQARNG